MKNIASLLSLLVLLGVSCQNRKNDPSLQSYSSFYQVDSGQAVNMVLTAYKTTLIANGEDHTRLRVAVADSAGMEITSSAIPFEIHIVGDARVESPDQALVEETDSAGQIFWRDSLVNGRAELVFYAGTKPDRVKVEVRSGTLWPASHEIHTLPAGFRMMEPDLSGLPPARKDLGRMIGADISFLPQLEYRGMKFYEDRQEKDAVRLLAEHGFNYIRLRLFVNPENEKGYSPGLGFCGLDSTLHMARRVKEAGMGLLLNFHYSDYWADPQQQYKPAAWDSLDFEDLTRTLKEYTRNVLQAFAAQGTSPDMVQVGNEINHGMLWPDGHIGNPDQLATLLRAAVEGVREADLDVPVMMHLALGGQEEEARFWLDNMIARGVDFDLIGLSYYPRWHGTLDDLNQSVHKLASRYGKPINIVEYSMFKKEVHDIVFSLPDPLGQGTCIWEPLNTWSRIFDREGNAMDELRIYDQLRDKYLSGGR